MSDTPEALAEKVRAGLDAPYALAHPDVSLAAASALDALLARLTELGHALAREQSKPGGSFDQWALLQAAEADRDRYKEALEQIASDDDLVDANEDAFSVHAFRRCQEVARAALSPAVLP